MSLQDAVDAETPLKPSELGVLRAQYEKEGDMVGVQTKFNYAWVRRSDGSYDSHLRTASLTPLLCRVL